MPSHQRCIERQNHLLNLIPARSAGDFPNSGLLLERMGERYSGQPAARRKALERDLDNLLAEGRILVSNPGGKPRHFQRHINDGELDPRLRDYTERLIQSLVTEALPQGQFAKLWQGLGQAARQPILGEHNFRVISDSLRLQPAAIRPQVLIDILEALCEQRTLRVGYRKPSGEQSFPTLHPHALLQRGPRLYLYALKNDEDTVKMFALHRMTSSQAGSTPARIDPDFDLETRIREGDADFGGGEMIELQLRVRGYVDELLRVCQLSADQQIDDCDEHGFTAQLRATVPLTGQLWHWLLGCGANIEVIAPQTLREHLARHTQTMAAIYAPAAASPSRP